MSKYIIYGIWVGITITIIVSMMYNIIKYKKIKLISVNPINVLIGVLFWGALWLVDVTALTMSDEGIKSKVGFIPYSAFQSPALETYIPMLLFMWIVVFYFSIANKRIKITKFRGYNYGLIFTMFMGLFLITITSILLIIHGHDAIIDLFKKKFYVLGLYHSTLTILTIPISILMLELK